MRSVGTGFACSYIDDLFIRSNEYYKLLCVSWKSCPKKLLTREYCRFDEKWNFRKWNGPIQYEDTKTKSLMMLTTDMCIATDSKFKPVAQKYAQSEEAFFDDFSKAFAKLLELGVPEKNYTSTPLTLGDD